MRFIIPAFIISIVLFSCQSRSAFDFNQKLVEIENSLGPDLDNMDWQVTRYVESGNYDSIALVSGKMVRIIERKIDEIKQIPAPKVKEGELFKKAYIRYFEYLAMVFAGYQKYGSEASEEGRILQSEHLARLLEKKDQVTSELQGIQLQYAKANGFEMEE